jgi:predicted ribonuclease YlaK
LAEADEIILNLIQQKHTWCKDVHEAYENASKALQEELDLLNRLYNISLDFAILIPDTNALLYNPNIETWSFPETSKLLLILLPTVLSELDNLKVNHRNEDVRKKSESLIKRIKEYRRRGNLLSGITIVKDKIKIQALAIEPDMQNSLPWLDLNNSDDRIIAAIIEVMRLYPKSMVAVVSRDINFQNKADFARIPFVEPPEPSK